VTIPVGQYDFQDFFVGYTMGEQRPVSGTLSLQRGEYFDGHLTAVTYQRARIEVTPQLSVQPGVSINRIELPQAAFTLKLITSRVTYTVTPRMFVSGLLQYNSSAASLSANLRLRWEYQPGSELFLVYNDQRDTSLRGAPFLQSRAFVVKLHEGSALSGVSTPATSTTRFVRQSTAIRAVTRDEMENGTMK